ncbi:MAG: hypothetical protein M3177_00945 [Pseudomonadota bacterium]|nr:hypothetical protein [Pseudomonadota bacterium]
MSAFQPIADLPANVRFRPFSNIATAGYNMRSPVPMIGAPTNASLWVVEYHEPRANDLCVTLIEAHVGAETVASPFDPANPVHPTNESRVFRVTWFNYVAFCVRNESYALPEGEQGGSGLGTMETSHFRDYVANATFATADYPGALIHWFLSTEWHCFDVIAVDEPEIQEVSGSEAASIIAKYH